MLLEVQYAAINKKSGEVCVCERKEKVRGKEDVDEGNPSTALCRHCAKAYSIDCSGPVL
jgi:hypothetical protein